MARSYSLDLRKRVMDDVGRGLPPEQAARKYSVTVRTIYAWKQLQRETGDIQPRRGATGPRPKLTAVREAIEMALRENPSLTLTELRLQLKLPGCLQTLWNALRRWGLVLKKSHPSGGTATPRREAEASLVGHPGSLKTRWAVGVSG